VLSVLTRLRGSSLLKKAWVLVSFCNTENLVCKKLEFQMDMRAAVLFSGGHSDDVDYLSWNPTHPDLFCTSSQKDRRIVFWDARRMFFLFFPTTCSFVKWRDWSFAQKAAIHSNVPWRFRRYKQITPRTGDRCCMRPLAINFSSWRLERKTRVRRSNGASQTKMQSVLDTLESCTFSLWKGGPDHRFNSNVQSRRR